MKYQPIPADQYVENRKHFAQHLASKSMAVFQSNDILPTNADGTMPFRQNNDLFYLCGVDQEESVLVLFPEAHQEGHREILFLKETNENIAIWEGEKLTVDQARKLTGIQTVYWLDQFENVFKSLAAQADHIYLNSNEHLRSSSEVETREMRFSKWCREAYPMHNYKRSAPIMHNIRSLKSNPEVEQIKKAIAITEKGFRRLLGFVKPGVMEFEIEAELSHEFLRNRSRGFAYSPIIASGPSACILHYIDNDKVCKDGDLLLMDFGAEYGNYASDLTRCIPVNGRFTERQKQVYQAVLRVMKEARQMLVPGTLLSDYHREVGTIMEKELIGLGLLDEKDVQNQDPSKPLYKKYFMHGTSHYLGLDVHDVGSWTEPIKAGMVFTCEPGIYIREEGLGIRIENDILVTDGKPVDLMESIPIEVEEIETLMSQKVTAAQG